MNDPFLNKIKKKRYAVINREKSKTYSPMYTRNHRAHLCFFYKTKNRFLALLALTVEKKVSSFFQILANNAFKNVILCVTN